MNRRRKPPTTDTSSSTTERTSSVAPSSFPRRDLHDKSSDSGCCGGGKFNLLIVLLVLVPTTVNLWYVHRVWSQTKPGVTTGTSAQRQRQQQQHVRKVNEVNAKIRANSNSFMASNINGNNEEAFDEEVKQILSTEKNSLDMIIKLATRKRPVWDQAIDANVEHARCQRYNLQYNSTTKTKRRRIFWGSILTDESSWHVLSALAMESYGIYHVAAFVESNRTDQFEPRTLRFKPSTTNAKRLRHSGMFGPETKVFIDHYINEEQVDPSLYWDQSTSTGSQPTTLANVRADMQRELIRQRWITAGMRPDDIGIITETDEIFTRDFLRAAQICDIPEFRPHQSCRTPKVMAKGRIFQSTPDCVVANAMWWHPEMIIGECIEGVGNDSVHKPAMRVYHDGTMGWRRDGYGGDKLGYDIYLKEVHGITDPKAAETDISIMYPLWNAADFRRTVGGKQYGWEDTGGLPTGFHLHNFFKDFLDMRRKYTKPDSDNANAKVLQLRMLHADARFFVDCVTNTTQGPQEKRLRVPNGLKGLEDGFRPLAFEYEAYVRLRQKEAASAILNDKMRNRGR